MTILPHPDENRVSIFVTASDFFHLFCVRKVPSCEPYILISNRLWMTHVWGERRQQDWCPDLLTNGNFSHFPTYVKQTLYSLEQIFSRFISKKWCSPCIYEMICQNIRQLWWRDNKIACNMCWLTKGSGGYKNYFVVWSSLIT